MAGVLQITLYKQTTLVLSTLQTENVVQDDYPACLPNQYLSISSIRRVRPLHPQRALRQRVLAGLAERVPRPAAEGVLCAHAALPHYLLRRQDQPDRGQ